MPHRRGDGPWDSPNCLVLTPASAPASAPAPARFSGVFGGGGAWRARRSAPSLRPGRSRRGQTRGNRGQAEPERGRAQGVEAAHDGRQAAVRPPAEGRQPRARDQRGEGLHDFTHALVVRQSPSARQLRHVRVDYVGLQVQEDLPQADALAHADLLQLGLDVVAGRVREPPVGAVDRRLPLAKLSSRLMRSSLQAARCADPEEMRLLRQKLMNAAGASDWFWHIAILKLLVISRSFLRDFLCLQARTTSRRERLLL